MQVKLLPLISPIPGASSTWDPWDRPVLGFLQQESVERRRVVINVCVCVFMWLVTVHTSYEGAYVCCAFGCSG